EKNTDGSEIEEELGIMEDGEKGAGWLSEGLIKQISENLKEVIAPSGTTRVPSGLGTKASGKLKASKWHSLFVTYPPLTAIDVFIGDYE
ncbi:hypothetical protein CROQUDRAFT_28427, partial [Cronartium quercuum f. sp. fusiforme G11]